MTLGAAGLLVACGGNDAPKRQTTVVTGQVINRAADGSGVILWNLCDPISDNRLARRLADDGSFRFETDGITDYHNATLAYGNSYIDFFVSPGDSVYLTIDASRLWSDGADAIRFSGANAAENMEICRNKRKITEMFHAEYQINLDVEPDTLLADVRSRMARIKDSIAKLDVSPAMQDFLCRDQLFQLANRLVVYRMRENDAEAQQKVFGDSLFGIHDATNFKTMMFPYHLLSYMQAKLFADSVLAQASEQGQQTVMMRRGIELLGQEPASKSRDVMRWKFLSGGLIQNLALYDSVPEMRSAFDDPSLNERLAELVVRLGTPTFPETPMEGITYMEADSTLTELPEGDFFAYLTARYPGKVLYIDVYSPGCSPCRAEMKFAPALHEALHGKDVVFVNLCLFSDRETWRRMVAQMPVVGENYWFDLDATNLFMGTYDLAGYPTYILVGRDGKIVTMDAERPSSKDKLVKQLEEQLAR